jgi:hypothetical protein
VTAVDVDGLPPTQYLIMDVLAARWRTGEHLWTFPTRPGIVGAAHDLARAGLVGMKSGVAPKTIQVWLTDAGKAAVLMPGRVNPVDEPRRIVVDWVRRSSNHVDGEPLLWPVGLGPEPSWFAGEAILADPVLSARYGLNEEATTP